MLGYIDVSWEDILGRPSPFDTAPLGMNDVDGMCKVKLSCGRGPCLCDVHWDLGSQQSRHGSYRDICL